MKERVKENYDFIFAIQYPKILKRLKERLHTGKKKKKKKSCTKKKQNRD